MGRADWSPVLIMALRRVAQRVSFASLTEGCKQRAWHVANVRVKISVRQEPQSGEEKNTLVSMVDGAVVCGAGRTPLTPEQRGATFEALSVGQAKVNAKGHSRSRHLSFVSPSVSPREVQCL